MKSPLSHFLSLALSLCPSPSLLSFRTRTHPNSHAHVHTQTHTHTHTLSLSLSQVEAESIDKCLLIFVLSAINPDKMVHRYEFSKVDEIKRHKSGPKVAKNSEKKQKSKIGTTHTDKIVRFTIRNSQELAHYQVC